ncbi:unnamed protein product [Coccothraustes coccothraustes]
MAAAGENSAARRNSRETSRFSLHHGAGVEAPCARPRLRRRWRERPRSGGTGLGPGAAPWSRPVLPRLAAPSIPVRPVPPRPENSAASAPSRYRGSAEFLHKNPPRRMRGDTPAALPGVVADEFSLANIVQAANMKLAAAESELKCGDPSC